MLAESGKAATCGRVTNNKSNCEVASGGSANAGT
jgi:hypothetical protein